MQGNLLSGEESNGAANSLVLNRMTANRPVTWFYIILLDGVQHAWIPKQNRTR